MKGRQQGGVVSLSCILVLLFLVAEGVNALGFGHDLLPQFMLAKGYTNLNHGSFGAPPHVVIDAQHQWEAQMELNPDKWFRGEVYKQMNVVRKAMAKEIGANEEDVAFITNASHGVNAILRSIRLKKNEKVLYLSLAYPMVKNTLQYLHDNFDESLFEIPITTLSDEVILKSVEDALNSNPDVRLATFSHITSTPALTLPVKKLTELCHKRGVLVSIDGAHALGNIPINVTDIGADFYLTNGHKWFYTPKGSALLWVKEDKQDLIYPTVISLLGQGATRYQLAFSYEGTADYSAYLSFLEAIKFRESVGGGQAIMDWMHSLALEGGKLLSNKWNTELLVDNPAMLSAMINVRIPTDDAEVAQRIPSELQEKYDTFVPVFNWQGKWYVRVSAQIYNQLSDFSMLADAVLAIIQKM